jgi:hypothetical protein
MFRKDSNEQAQARSTTIRARQGKLVIVPCSKMKIWSKNWLAADAGQRCLHLTTVQVVSQIRRVKRC